jgi:hypothetical protein
MRFAGRPLDAAGIAACYEGLIDGLVADEPARGLPVLQTDMRMDTGEARRRLAEETLRFGLTLA